MTVKLITIPFSHFCEKARWALDRVGVAYDEDSHLPLFHYVATTRRGGKSVPVLLDGKTVVRDSTDIIAWADAKKPGSLIPLAGAEDALAIEDDFDNHLGPATRRWGYYYLLPKREADAALVQDVPRWQAALLKLTRPLAVRYLRRSLKIDADGVERSRKKIDETFARVDDVLRDGRKYLVGDRFSVADLTFAALAAPVLFPDGHPAQKFSLDWLPAEAQEQVDRWRHSRAGQFALRMYADHRAARAA
jgi:glutathione S-transferase